MTPIVRPPSPLLRALDAQRRRFGWNPLSIVQHHGRTLARLPAQVTLLAASGHGLVGDGTTPHPRGLLARRYAPCQAPSPRPAPGGPRRSATGVTPRRRRTPSAAPPPPSPRPTSSRG